MKEKPQNQQQQKFISDAIHLMKPAKDFKINIFRTFKNINEKKGASQKQEREKSNNVQKYQAE